jgi:hypothetical protein
MAGDPTPEPDGAMPPRPVASGRRHAFTWGVSSADAIIFLAGANAGAAVYVQASRC